MEPFTARERSARRRRRTQALAFVLVVVVGLAVLAAIVLGSRSAEPQQAAPPPPVSPPAAPPAPPPPPTLREQQDRAVARLGALGRPVFCGAPRGRELALTFDDGPGPYTDRLLRILRRRHAQATFFLVGNRIRYWQRLPRIEAALGALGDHTWDHADLMHMPRGRAMAEINRARAAIAAASGTTVNLFRPPYGVLPAALRPWLRARGLLEVGWSSGARDYVPGLTARRLVRELQPSLVPGAIVILHDIHPVTVRALPLVLDAIAKRHLRAVSVPELLRYDPPSLVQLRADERGRSCVR